MRKRKSPGRKFADSPDLLGLPGYRAVSLERDDDGDPIVIAAPPEPHEGCPVCRGRTRTREVFDLPLQSRPCRVRLRQARCLPAPPDVLFPTSWRMTRRLADFAALLALREPVAKVAKITGLPREKLGVLLWAVGEEVDRVRAPSPPRHLGLDYVELNGKGLAVLCDVDKKRLIEIVPRDELAGLLARLAARGPVERVAMDLDNSLRHKVRAAWPGAVLVADKRHLLELARGAVKKIRLRLRGRIPVRLRGAKDRPRVETVGALLSKRKHALSPQESGRLAVVFAAHPVLRDAYEAKEAFYRLYDLPDAKAARAAFETWRAALPVELRQAFKGAVTAVAGTWRQEALASFDQPRITTGHVEACNRQLGQLLAERRGALDLPTLRLKALFRMNGLKEATVRAAVARALCRPPAFWAAKRLARRKPAKH